MMNWKRGFFRAWLVISVVWLVFALAVTDLAGFRGAEIENTVVQVDQINMLDEGGGIWTASIAAYSLQLEIEAPEQVVPGTQAWDTMLVTIATRFSTMIATVNNIAAQRNRESMHTFSWMALAPIILLVLGVGIGWVLQGFSRRSR